MANPALKNGYMSVAFELVEVFARTNIPGNEMRIIWALWRKTWCWKDGNRHKDWDWVSYSQFSKLTQINHRSIGKCIKSLVGKRLLEKSKNGYKFNQNYDEWVVGKRLPDIRTVGKRLLGSRQKATETSRQKATHNNYIITTNTITKEKTQIASQSLLINKLKNMKTYSENEHSDSDFPIIDIETGEMPIPKKKTPKNKLAIRAQQYFIDKAKTAGLSAIQDVNGYFLILDMMRKANLDAKLIKQRIDDWFDSGVPADEMVSITRCFSARSVEKWKVNNGIK